jgi:hypothetical protein
MKDSFIIYKSFFKPISNLSDKQLGRLFRAIFAYQLGEVVSVDNDIKMAFDFFQNQFEIDEIKYQKIIQKNTENGRRGGRPKSAEKNPNNPPLFEKPKKADNDNDNDNDNVFKEKIDKKENFDFFKSLIAIGVSEQVASDWLKVRKTKKATNTKTAFDRILTEINNSNQSADYCIRIAVEKNWQGFRAEWLNNLTNQSYGTITNTRDKGIIAHPAEGEEDEITTFRI